MADNSGQAAPPIAPPLLIGICILGAVITVIVTAALYKLCRRATAEVDQVSAEKPWNPNQRSVEQSQYMEKVRLRNKMYAWERSKAGRGDEYGQKRVEKQRRDRELAEEEYLDEISLIENPYEEMVDDCVKRQSYQVPRASPQEPWTQRTAPEEFLSADFQMPASQMAVLPDTDETHLNHSGVRITVNDSDDDLADMDPTFSSKWPARPSRMLRSSSVYSGDALLPSTHLHLVHSSSTYALGQGGPSSYARH